MVKQKIDINCAEEMDLLRQYGLQDLDTSQGYRVTFRQGEFISHAGQPMDCIYFVISGKAKVFLSLSSGKQLLLAYFTSKGIIGDIELMTSKPTNYTTVQAVTKFTCLALPLGIYGDALKTNNAFINYIAIELAEKLTQRVVNGAITTLQPVESRLCAYITQTAVKGVFREKLTDVAVVVGASYRHLLRCLDKLCRDGVLVREGRRFRIVDWAALGGMAGDLYLMK